MKKDMSKDMRRISLVLEKCAFKWLRIRQNEDVLSFAPFKYVWVKNGTHKSTMELPINDSAIILAENITIIYLKNINAFLFLLRYKN